MLLLILAAIWAAVLVPPIIRNRADGRPADSISDFRNRLHVLQRTGPSTVAPANSLRDARGGGLLGSMPAAFRARTAAYNQPARSARPVTNSADAARRARTLKRRRDVLFGLLASMVGTLVLSFIPSFAALLYLHLILDLVFVGYVALLVRLRTAAAEREMKLRFLPGAQGPEPALLLRRSAN
ncbi:MAG: hypothetical protein QOG03_2282 [Actinomycetota bacterium]|nr:hypothetical protein [Actinomycetota bacterium]